MMLHIFESIHAIEIIKQAGAAATAAGAISSHTHSEICIKGPH